MEDLLFWGLALLLTASALGVVLSRNLWRAAYSLAGALVATAVFYLLLTSPLLAAVQILLYTGGVLTLVVYALVITAQSDDPRRWRRPWPALVLSLAVFLVLVAFVGDLEPPGPAGGLEDGRQTGIALFREYVVPFELLSLLLLGAIFGALAIARKEDTP
jgi:NADH-quinone oxidoreductase subunit J